MRTRVLSLLALACFAFVPGAARATSTVIDQRLCPIPVVGGDADRVELATTGTRAYQVIVDESVGEASHIVAGNLMITKDGDKTSPDFVNTAGSAPITLTFTLDAGHRYTIDWQADFDFGIHPCASEQSDQTPFTITT